MFDANLRWLPRGMEFFAKVHYVEDNDLGLVNDQLIFCKMLEESEENPRVEMFLPTGNIITRCEDLHYTWIVYEGAADGTGFIDEASKWECMDYLKMIRNTRRAFFWEGLTGNTCKLIC